MKKSPASNKPFNHLLWLDLPELHHRYLTGVKFHTGNIRMDEVLMYIADMFDDGCDVHITSFSIGEEFGRAIHWLKENKKVNNLRVILDHSVKANKQHYLLFSQQVIDELYFTSIHAKVMLIKGHRFSVVVHSSANFSINPRWECTLISYDEEMYNTLLAQFNEIVKTAERYDLG